jgi:hypothetical protein
MTLFVNRYYPRILEFCSFERRHFSGGTPSVSNYTDYYMLPNNYLRLRAIIDPSIPLSQREYEIQGNTLLYNNDEEDTSIFGIPKTRRP